MSLLDAAAASCRQTDLVVATFDHGTGTAATEAAVLVADVARRLGLRCIVGRADRHLTSEADWRDSRWRFLRSVARAVKAVIATAHTRSDQVETVLMRTMRGAGARGLAGLYARGSLLRPLLGHSRNEIERYVRARCLQWVEDPSNDSPRFFRNRVRHDMLPALRRARPSIDDELLEIARRAAAWRAGVEDFVETSIPHVAPDGDAGLDVSRTDISRFASESLAVLWPPLAAKAGLALDRRGTARLAAFTRQSRVGARIQLSGGWEVVGARNAFELRRLGQPAPASRPINGSETVSWGAWSFRTVAAAGNDAWTSWLPDGAPLVVRVWQAGDVMAARVGGPNRKIKRFLSDAGITGHERGRWPVVLAGDRIVWIPGVHRSELAPGRSDRPGLVFSCEYRYR
jgi:tRNA(Ile)-lysidine synthase